MSYEEITAAAAGLPAWVWYAAGAVLAVLVAVVLLVLAARRRSAKEPGELLVERFRRRRTRRLASLVLESCPDKGLFSVFLAALDNRRIARDLLAFMESSEDLFIFRRLALSGRGEVFDGAKGADLFREKLDRVRELTGDPEWPARYMAVRILLADADQRSRRAAEELFHDPHTLIRKTLIESYEPADEEGRGRFYDLLVSYLTDDTAYEVRKAARERLAVSFPERYSVDFSSLSPDRAVHVVEQFRTSSMEDRGKALELLEQDDLEIRFAAAQFLQSGNFLDPLFLEVSFTDRGQMERNGKLLRKAVEVNVTGFLDNITMTSGLETLSIAADILLKSGNPELITVLAEKVLLIVPSASENADTMKLFRTAMECVRTRSTEKTATLIAGKLRERCSAADECARILLDAVPGGFPQVILPALMDLLKSGECAYRDELHGAFLRYEASFYLDQLMDILKSGREHYAHEVRISALILLGKLNLTYCMQFLLEQMPVLPFEEARDFSLHLKEYAGKLFEQRVIETLDRDDGKVRAALICAVPATGIKEFLKPIREAIGDADPEVRRAAVWALLEYGDQKSIRASVDLLRDPVERVRVEAAHALASRGSDSILDSFQEILADANEVEPVQTAVLEGLSRSASPKAVDLLVGQLKERPDRYSAETVAALSAIREAKQIKRLIEKMKDAGPELRDRITAAFIMMGEEAEKPLLDLLAEGISSLKANITDVLEATGYVEHAIRKLNHRDPQVRRDAAEKLSLVGTVAAFRGIVLAGRDPDQDVRVMVTKALEQLGTAGGKEILESLKADPDKRIRKYTLWALERIEAKGEL